MARFAVIENNQIINVIIAESGVALGDKLLIEVADDSMVAIGWGYVNGDFVAPPEPEPIPPTTPTQPGGALPVTEL